MKPSSRIAALLLAILAGATAACDDGVTAPDALSSGPDRLTFSPASLELDPESGARVELRNEGARAVGPIALEATDAEGATPGAARRLTVVPAEIATLNPGEQVAVDISVDAAALPAGDYRVALGARVDSTVLGAVELSLALRPLAVPTAGSLTESLAIVSGPNNPSQGEVARFTAETLDGQGNPVPDTTLTWYVVPPTAGFVTPQGRFVGYEPGPARLFATASALLDSLDITIRPRNGLEGQFRMVGSADAGPRLASDIWVHGNVAYTGTWRWVTVDGKQLFGDRLYVWDISQPPNPTRIDSVIVEARTVNDVKIRADGQLAVITHEISDDGLNGITLLDTTDPRHPRVITRYTDNLAEGVHNVWIDGDLLYVVRDGFGTGLQILDISDPAHPMELGRFYAGSSFLHDVYVRDGLAFLSHWDAGLVILDVGNGMAGGSPANPVELGRVLTAGGNTHNAWYWPEAGYVFVGEEVDSGAPPGAMHVVDVSDMSNPREVASFYIESWTPHNFWLDEAEAILYMAWYGEGLIALDVSGELLGELARQDREIARTTYGGTSGRIASPLGVPAVDPGIPDPGKSAFGLASSGETRTWAPQLHNGRIYLSDINRGLWVLRPGF